MLVPADMTLHALHYAIMRLFGWQNCHLHHYELPPKTFAHLTEDNLSKWLHLVGVYFRFPGEDWEDLYWDDDYRGDQGLKTWLKKKYTGPYIYKGWSEHYLSSQQAVQEWISQAGQHQGSLQEQRFVFENPHLEALLERLTVSDLLIPNHQYIQTKSIQAYVRRVLNWPDVENSLQEAGSKKFRSHKQARIYYEEHDPKPMPLTHLLHYFYDEGDGWATKEMAGHWRLAVRRFIGVKKANGWTAGIALFLHGEMNWQKWHHVIVRFALKKMGSSFWMISAV